MIYVLLVLASISVALLFALIILCSKFSSLQIKQEERLTKNLTKDIVLNVEKDIGRDIAVLNNSIRELDKRNLTLNTIVEKRLEEIRLTVDEKLQSTLEKRLSTSFKEVGDQLEKVYTQLGEVQNLAKEVGSLEKVLTNVKTRGVWGELQAERILQDMLLPEQYIKNAVTKAGSSYYVEFAIKLPGQNNSPVLLPIDSKFPKEDYEKLLLGWENNSSESIALLKKSLRNRILSESKDICEKYIDVPNTTDFAILFLPVEGLYAEVLSYSGLQEEVQRKYHVMIAGPTTLASLLNSLQMGFRTLAIEKKSSEVWHILGQVKTEYSKLEDVLDKIKKKLELATNEIDEAYTRHKVMSRHLKNVEAVEISSDNLIEG